MTRRTRSTGSPLRRRARSPAAGSCSCLPATTDAALLDVFEEARVLGFLGPGPVAEHVEHADGFIRAWDAAPPAFVVDLGSGAGIPGLVLADRWPDASIVLVEASDRRSTFLRLAVQRVGLPHVAVRRDRAEIVGHDPEMRAAADLVVARSFALPAVTAECAAPLLRIGGRLIVSDPPDGVDGRWPADELGELGLGEHRQVRVPAAYTVLEQVAPCPARFPRRVGIPAKRPLF